MAKYDIAIGWLVRSQKRTLVLQVKYRNLLYIGPLDETLYRIWCHLERKPVENCLFFFLYGEKGC